MIIIKKIRDLSCTAIEIGSVSIIWLCLSNVGVTLEPPKNLAQIQQRTSLSQRQVFVNPNVADTKGNGSNTAPFKTITAALQMAPPNSTIILANGTYNTASGETFPLKLKPGVTVQGEARSRGSKIVITGGDTFFSPTSTRQNITILGANKATLTGVTVTNPNPRGYGLWIESSSPIVIGNTFTSSKHDGISITGNSAPTIRSNYFIKNGANGITVYGVSRPEIRANLFENTGFGINIAQKAAPLLVANHIKLNRSGIVVQAFARPILRTNLIEANQEDGLVAIASSLPDLGIQGQPGGNVFRQNGRYDINSTSRQVISALGNTLNHAQTVGNIDLSGNVNLAATPLPPRAPVNTRQPKTNSLTTGTTAMMPINIPVPPPTSAQLAIKPTTTSNSTRPRIPQKPQLPLASGSDSGTSTPLAATTSQTILPPPPNPNSSPMQALPVLKSAPIAEADLLPVPTGRIPVGNARNLPKVKVPRNYTSTPGSPPLPPTRASSMGLRYRVVVEAENKSKQDLVRSLIPGAFRTFANGKVLMQVGAFGDRANALEVIQMFNSRGLKANVETMR